MSEGNKALALAMKILKKRRINSPPREADSEPPVRDPEVEELGIEKDDDDGDYAIVETDFLDDPEEVASPKEDKLRFLRSYLAHRSMRQRR